MTPTRRRFLSISAAAIALPGMAAAQPVARWRGRALGADAEILLSGISPVKARPVLAAMEQELDRLERIFSLFRDDSALRRLNTTGELFSPPADLLTVLGLSDRLHRATGGVFDPTVQPLWQALAQGQATGPARALVGWNGLRWSATRVAFARPGMALTLNGVAQGHITDRIAALLRARGFRDILVNMGEIAALGQAPDGGNWQAGIAAPDGRLVSRVALSDRALATSAPAAQGADHILGPQGQPVRHRLVSVSAPSAAVADGLSTALCLLTPARAQAAVAGFPGAKIEYLRA